MTVEELITKLQAFPPGMVVKVRSVTVDDIANVAQDGEDYVKITLE